MPKVLSFILMICWVPFTTVYSYRYSYCPDLELWTLFINPEINAVMNLCLSELFVSPDCNSHEGEDLLVLPNVVCLGLGRESCCD